MKQVIIILTLLVTFTACKTSTHIVAEGLDKKACKHFNKQVSVVKDFNNEVIGYGNELKSASSFLEKITEIKPEGVYNYTGLGSEASAVEDLNQWESWFSKNKHLLYWDKENKVVKVKTNSHNNNDVAAL